MATFEDLPPEIKEKIFSLLDFRTTHTIAILVCKKWFQFIRQSFKLSGNLDIRQDRYERFRGLEFLLTRNWPGLKNLTLRKRYSDSENWRFMSRIIDDQRMIKMNTNLERIIVKAADSPNIYMEKSSFFFKHYGRIKVFSNHFSFKMKNCQFHWTCERILQVAEPIQLTFKNVTQTHLDLFGVEFEKMLSTVQDLCVIKIDREVFKFLVHRVPRLKTLFLCRVNEHHICDEIDEAFRVNPNLKNLVFSTINSERIFKHCLKFQNLQKLAFTHITFPEGLPGLNQCFNNLNEASFIDCSISSEAWKVVIKCMPNLNRLKYGHNSNGELMDMTLLEFMMPIKELRKLRKLDAFAVLTGHKNEDILEWVRIYTRKNCYVRLFEQWPRMRAVFKPRGMEPCFSEYGMPE